MSKTVRYFTVEEAQTVLPTVKRLMAELLERRGRAAQLSQTIGEPLKDLRSNLGGPAFTELTAEFERIQALMAELEAMGCVIKNLNAGLVDFLSQINGRDVYLCWRYGEETIAFYHELHTGFKGRQPL